MNYETFLEKLPKQMAETGCRLDLRIYAYPEGHGFLFALDGKGKVLAEGGKPVKIPYANRQAGLKMLSDILEQAEQFAVTK